MLAPFIEIIYYLLDLVWWLVIASAVASWLIAFGVVNTRNQAVYTIVSFLNRATEPLYRPIRRVIPLLGGLDLSPLIVLAVIYILQREIAISLMRQYF